MTKIEEIKDKVNKGHYIFTKESYYGTTWLDSEAEEDVEYLLKELEKLQKALQFYAEPDTYGREHLSQYGYIIIDKDNGEIARQALKEETE